MDYLIVYTSLGPIHIFSIYLSLSRPKRKTIYLCSFLINFLFKLKVVKKQNSKYTMLIPYKHWQKHYVHYKQRDKLAENSMVRGCSIIYNQLYSVLYLLYYTVITFCSVSLPLIGRRSTHIVIFYVPLYCRIFGRMPGFEPKTPFDRSQVCNHWAIPSSTEVNY